jgi:CRISPR-associated exonuclease Cas4
MRDSEEEYLPLSALNDLLFCPRRCALHRVEGLWQENVHTIEGTHGHKKVHADPATEVEESAYRAVRGLWLRSDRLRLVGKADLVEFRPEPYPVEYKRGKRRKWDNDEVQLCAQALCLEEMLGQAVPAGAIFHVRSRRRREVVFDEKLRRDTEEAVQRLQQLVESGEVPAPVLHPKCKQCSLHNVCMPELLTRPSACTRLARSLFIVPADG